MTATIESKARRLLTEGQVFVKWSTPDQVCAVVRGDHGVHDVHLHGARWHCSCPAYRPDCSHVIAVRLVTTSPLPTTREANDSAHDQEDSAS